MIENKPISALFIIPEMTDPLGKAWIQPYRSAITIDYECAYMNQDAFDMLLEYSGSNPPTLFNGKMWKCVVRTTLEDENGAKINVSKLRWCHGDSILQRIIHIVPTINLESFDLLQQIQNLQDVASHQSETIKQQLDTIHRLEEQLESTQGVAIGLCKFLVSMAEDEEQ